MLHYFIGFRRAKVFGGCVVAASLALGAPAQASVMVYDIVEGFGLNRPTSDGPGQTQQGNDNWWYHTDDVSWWDASDDPNDYDLLTHGRDGTGPNTNFAWTMDGSNTPAFRNADWDSRSSVAGTSVGDAIWAQVDWSSQLAIEWLADADGWVDVALSLAGRDAEEFEGNHVRLLHWDAAAGESTLLDEAEVFNSDTPSNPKSLSAEDVAISVGDSIIVHVNVAGGNLPSAGGHDGVFIQGDLTYIPEPGSLALLGLGSLLMLRRRRHA